VLEIIPDSAPDPAIERLPFAIFPFRFHANEVPYTYRNSGWYNRTEDIDYGYLHEMAHQLGLIDIYQLDISPSANQVSGLGYTAVDDLMRANPFGYVAVVGGNGVLHFRIEYHGSVDYAWLDITEASVAYYLGQTNRSVFERRVALGGPKQIVPPPELTETNAGDWVTWAEGSGPGGTYVTNDSQRRQVGTASLKFVTDGGFDTYLRYPGSCSAQWDLSSVSTLNIRFYAQNVHGFQSGSPWIRLKDAEGNFFRFCPAGGSRRDRPIYQP
jgi:hypothetical protein